MLVVFSISLVILLLFSKNKIPEKSIPKDIIKKQKYLFKLELNEKYFIVTKATITKNKIRRINPDLEPDIGMLINTGVNKIRIRFISFDLKIPKIIDDESSYGKSDTNGITNVHGPVKKRRFDFIFLPAIRTIIMHQ